MSVHSQIREIQNMVRYGRISKSDAAKLISLIPGAQELIESKERRQEVLVTRRIDIVARVRTCIRATSFLDFLELHSGFIRPKEKHLHFDAVEAEVCFQLDINSLKVITYDRGALTRWRALNREFVLWRDIPAKTQSAAQNSFGENGNFVPFWNRDPRAIKERDTRITFRDYPEHERTLKLQAARQIVAPTKPSRNLLIAAVRSRKAKA